MSLGSSRDTDPVRGNAIPAGRTKRHASLHLLAIDIKLLYRGEYGCHDNESDNDDFLLLVLRHFCPF